jgi:predicted nucleic acid-binding protein
MSDTLVDSSVVAKWILPEADSAHAQRLITDVAGAGERLIILDLVFPEVANAIWKQHLRGLITPDEANDFLDTLLHIPVSVEPAFRLLGPAMQIAVKYRRAVYDALFVALAQDFDIPAITADEPLVSVVQADFPRITLLRDWP